MKYISVEEASKKFNISARSVRNYCAQGRIVGAILKGKTWLIPIDAEKPSRINNNELDIEAINHAEELISFIDDSPVSYLAIKNVKDNLIKNGYKEIKENENHIYHKGDKIFLIRNDSTLIAVNIGEDYLEDNGFHIIASHADSPCFKIKPNGEGKLDLYNKINIAPYGGLIAPTFMDRPLGIAGRLIYEKDDEIITNIIDFKDLTTFIPNVCIHFNRDINNGYQYDMAVDMQSFFSTEEASTYLDAISKRLKINKENIINYDLYLYNKEKGILWGEKKEFISSPRLDDLECVFISSKAFINAINKKGINILYIADNEEVGSSSRQGADSDFLKSTLMNITKDLDINYSKVVASSYLISADNAHAVHPNKPSLTDQNNKIYMNKGIGIKFNAANSYTSDGLSSAIFQKICEKASAPYQFFTNRSDIRGGSTLGNILLSQISLMAVDVGLGQLAMHSSYETAGTIDIKYMYNAFKEFYQSNILINDNKIKIIKN